MDCHTIRHEGASANLWCPQCTWLACSENKSQSFSETTANNVETFDCCVPMHASTVANDLCEESHVDVDAVDLALSSESDVETGSISDYTSDSDSDAEVDACVKTSISTELAEWAVSNSIAAVGGLLSILKPHHPFLPSDPRTLLKTPLCYDFKEMRGSNGQSVGQYYHFGIAAGLIDRIPQNHAVSNNTLELQFNFDGLRLCVCGILAHLVCSKESHSFQIVCCRLILWI